MPRARPDDRDANERTPAPRAPRGAAGGGPEPGLLLRHLDRLLARPLDHALVDARVVDRGRQRARQVLQALERVVGRVGWTATTSRPGLSSRSRRPVPTS